MRDFDQLWRAAVRYRHVSRELESLLRDVHRSMTPVDADPLRESLERLLVFLVSERGRTDANCSVVSRFMTETETEWQDVSGPLRAILDDMSGTLHDSVYAPKIATTFESTPEQLLVRVRSVIA